MVEVDVYAELEKRFAPVLAEVNERGTLPRDSLTGQLLLEFVATQAMRTLRTRELVRSVFDEAHLIAQQAEGEDEASFAERLKRWRPEVTDEEVARCFETRREFTDDMQARGGVVDQTTLVLQALELGDEVKTVLANRYWILGVASDGAQFITSDEPVRLQPATNARLTDPQWLPSLEDPDTDVMVALSSRLILIGRSRAHHRARVRLDRHQVAGFNTSVAFTARRFIYSIAPTFVYLASDGSVVDGPMGLMHSP